MRTTDTVKNQNSEQQDHMKHGEIPSTGIVTNQSKILVLTNRFSWRSWRPWRLIIFFTLRYRHECFSLRY